MRWYFCFVILLLFSCSSKHEVETISLDDILPQSTYVKDTVSSASDTTTVFTVSDFRKSIIDAVQDTSIRFANSQVTLKMFPDRLTNVSREQEFIALNTDSILIAVWEFADSLTTINAFYNWLDCFGDNCIELKIGDEVRFSTKNVLTMVSDHHLIYLESPTGFEMNQWHKEIVPQLFSEDVWIYSITQPAKRKSKWQIYDQ